MTTTGKTQDAPRRLGAYSQRQRPDGTTVWIRVGFAQNSDDGELRVVLNLVPVDGLLHIRDCDAPVLTATFDNAAPHAS